jgi:hypothetical protein
LKEGATSAELRNFGLITGGIFAGLFGALLPLAHHRAVPWWPWLLGVVLAGCGASAPKLLRYPYLIWERIGRALGWVNSRILLNLLFFGVFWPAALIARLAGHDSMKRRFAPEADSYRERSDALSRTSMEKPY